MPNRSKTSKYIQEPGGPMLSRGLVSNSAATSPPRDPEYENFLEELNLKSNTGEGRQIRSYMAASTDTRFLSFLSCLSDPSNRKSLVANAKANGIGLGEFMEFMRSVHNRRATMAAMEAVTDITKDTAKDARTKLVNCERCDGLGTVRAEDKTRVCPACDGVCKVSTPGNAHARDKIFEMTGLTGKKSAGVQIVQNFSGMGMESAVGKLDSITFEVEAEAD